MIEAAEKTPSPKINNVAETPKKDVVKNFLTKFFKDSNGCIELAAASSKYGSVIRNVFCPSMYGTFERAVDNAAEWLETVRSNDRTIFFNIIPLTTKPSDMEMRKEYYGTTNWLYAELSFDGVADKIDVEGCVEKDGHALTCVFQGNPPLKIDRPPVQTIVEKIIAALGVQPTLVVDNGAGYYVYFKTTIPLTPSEISKYEELITEKLDANPKTTTTTFNLLPGFPHPLTGREAKVVFESDATLNPLILTGDAHIQPQQPQTAPENQQAQPVPEPQQTPSRPELSPEIPVIELKPISISEKASFFQYGNRFVMIRKVEEGRFYIVISKENGDLEQPYEASTSIDCSASPLPLELCEELNKIVADYKKFVIQKYAEASFKAIKQMGVPINQPSEWESMITSLADILVKKTNMKVFVSPYSLNRAVIGTFCYENGAYLRCDNLLDHYLEEIVANDPFLKTKLTPPIRGNIIQKAKGMVKTFYEPNFQCLLFKDKVFCWDKFIETRSIEDALIDPSPNIILIHRIPWRINTSILKRPEIAKYVPFKNGNDILDAFRIICPKSFNAFLSWVKHPEETVEQALPKVLLLLEIIGYALYSPSYPFHKIILLVGEGQNGKSKYIQLIETIVGKHNVSSVGFEELDLDRNRFATFEMWGKLVNISTEPKRIEPGLLKKLTGEDSMPFEEKWGNRFTDKNRAKIISSANDLPPIKEDTYGFWRRWLVIEFPNKFPIDNTWFERTFTPDEIEGIILLSLYAFRMAFERNSFTEQGVKDPKEEWISRSNPAYRIIKKLVEEDYIEFTLDGYVVKKDFYALYNKYINTLRDEGEDVREVSQAVLTKTLEQFFSVKTGEKRVMGVKKKIYQGVAFKDYEKVAQLVGELETPPPSKLDYYAGE